MKRHGHSGERLWNIWREMRHRCSSRSDRDYFYYGLRGIRVCPEWEDFSTFMVWALENGYADDLTIDRIDHNGDYCPSNCRWVTRSENSIEAGRRRKGVTKEIQLNRKCVRVLAIAMINADSYDEAIDAMIEAFKSNILPMITEEGRPPAGGADGQ